MVIIILEINRIIYNGSEMAKITTAIKTTTIRIITKHMGLSAIKVMNILNIAIIMYQYAIKQQLRFAHIAICTITWIDKSIDT